MIKCPNAECGQENVDGTQFCEACGEELSQTATTTSAQATSSSAASPDMIKCPACDNLNPADNVVCEVCGTELHPAGSANAGIPNAGSATPPAPTSSTPSNDPFASVSTNPAPATSIAPSVDPLATGTSAPPLGATLPDVSTMPTVDVSATSSTAAPDAFSGIAPDVSASSAGFPVVATGDTTTSFGAIATSAIAGVPDVGMSGIGAAVTDPTTVAANPVVSTAPLAPDTTITPVAPIGNLQPGTVKLTVEQGMTVGKQFVLGDAEVLVGREDDEEGIYPDIDLSDQDEGFVHRKHAQLSFKDGALTVTHLGGANKTRVNNKPLDDNAPQAVNIGDKVSFGKVVMRVGSV